VSKARLVITAVLIEGRSQSQVASDYGLSQSWISRLIARYTLDGDAAFEPRSRRPGLSTRVQCCWIVRGRWYQHVGDR